MAIEATAVKKGLNYKRSIKIYFYGKKMKTHHHDLILFNYGKYAPLYTTKNWFE